MSVKKAIYLPVIGLSCNSNCIMCSVDSCNLSSKDKHCSPDGTTEQVMKDLVKGRKEGYERMEFTGGEPTVRKDIVYLVQKAHDLGYKDIGISTNGFLLSNKNFCNRLVKAGLTNVTISLHAHNGKLDELITRTPDSFSKTTMGIRNILVHKNVIVSVVTVIFRPNYRYITQIGKYIHSLGVSQWDITDLLPEGRAKKNYKTLSITRSELSKALYSLKPLLNIFQSIVLFAFSPCVVPPEILYDKRITLITAQQKLDVEKPLRYNQKESSNILPKGDSDNLLHQRKIEVCRNCIFSGQCAGIWTDYINLYGKKKVERETQELVNKYGYLRKNF